MCVCVLMIITCCQYSFLTHPYYNVVWLFFVSYFQNRQRGIVNYNSHNLIIHPLPKRFGQSTHIIYESQLPNHQLNNDERFNAERDNSNSNTADIDSLPDNRPRTVMHADRIRRYIASGSSRKIPHVLFVETAIFVDKDLFRHMAKNYPKHTEANLIRFVMAMINGVQCFIPF